MRIFTADWISWRKKHGTKVQLLTLLTIEKLSPSFGSRQHPTVFQRGENTGAKRKGGEIKRQKTGSLDFCTFRTLTSKPSETALSFLTWGKVKAAGYIDHGRNVFLFRNISIKKFLKQLGEGGVQFSINTSLNSLCCLFLSLAWQSLNSCSNPRITCWQST